MRKDLTPYSNFTTVSLRFTKVKLLVKAAPRHSAISRGHSAVPTFAGGTPPVPVAHGKPSCLSPSAFTVLPVARRRYPDCSLWGLKFSFFCSAKGGFNNEPRFITDNKKISCAIAKITLLLLLFILPLISSNVLLTYLKNSSILILRGESWNTIQYQ